MKNFTKYIHVIIIYLVLYFAFSFRPLGANKKLFYSFLHIFINGKIFFNTKKNVLKKNLVNMDF